MKDVKQLQELGWTIPGAISRYTEARRVLEFLRESGYLSNLSSDHQIAYDYTLAKCDKKAKAIFEYLINGDGAVEKNQ